LSKERVRERFNAGTFLHIQPDHFSIARAINFWFPFLVKGKAQRVRFLSSGDKGAGPPISGAGLAPA
jgi:hypothetical protein